MVHHVRAMSGWVLAGLALYAIGVELPRSLPGDGLLDFGSFVASGRAAAEGLNPYGIYPLTFHVSFPGFEAWNPNLNPPISAILFQAFDWTEPQRAFRIWWGVSVALYGLAVLLLVRRYGEGMGSSLVIALWLLALAGFWDTLVLGQIYIPLVVAGVAAWLLLERGHGVLAGMMIGLVVAMKPNFAVWPALLFLAGHWRPAVASGVTGAVIGAIPLAVYGPEVYRQWLTLVASDGDRAAFLTNASLAGIVARLGAPGLALPLSAAVLAVAALWALRRRPDAIRASEFGILGALLASPLAWIHYTLFLAPVLLRRFDRLSTRIVAGVLMVPVPFIIHYFGAPASIQAGIGSLYNWALVLCLAILVAEEIRGARGRTASPLTGAEPASPGAISRG
jgi:hypothetical protein